MARGSQRGEHRGGRKRGIPNKKTVERALAAERTIVEAQQSGRKLAKDVLVDFMHLFAGMAATYQPTPPTSAQVNPHQDWEKFDKYAVLAVETAAAAAKYESPTYKAIAVHMTPDQDGTKPAVPTAQVIDISNPQMLMRVYQRMLIASKR